MKKYFYSFLPLLALIFIFTFKLNSLAASPVSYYLVSGTSGSIGKPFCYDFYYNGTHYYGGGLVVYKTGSNITGTSLYPYTYSYTDLNYNLSNNGLSDSPYTIRPTIAGTGVIGYFSIKYSYRTDPNYYSKNVDFNFSLGTLTDISARPLTNAINTSLSPILYNYITNPPIELGQLNYSVVDLIGDRQSISLQFNGTNTGLKNGDFEVEYAIMDNSYAYDTSFNAITGQITGRSFFDWSNGRDPSTGDPYEMSDPDIGDWFLSGFLVSPNWNNINTDEVTVTDTLIPALTKNFYHKLSDPINIGSPDIYAFSYPGNISDHMDSYQYRNQLTGYNYMPSYSIYVRPVKDNNVGQWSVVSWYMNQNNEAVVSKTTPSQNSNNMPVNNSVQTITQGGDTYNIVNNTYPDGTTDYPVIDPIFSLPEIPSIESGEHDKEDSDILEKLKELIEAMKQFPDFLSRLFEFFKALLGWLPAWVINIIRLSFMFLFILILVRAVKIIV